MRYIFRKILYKISRKLIKYFFIFTLIASILCGSIFIKVLPVDAAATATGITFAEVLGYIGSTIGIVNATTNNGVTSAFGHMQDSLQEWWSQYSNDGIYEDSDGNIVFSGAATQAMYEALSSQASIDARVVSSFGGHFPYSNDYTSASFNTPISSFMAVQDDGSGEAHSFYYMFGVDSSHSLDSSNPYIINNLVCIDITDVAYFVIDSYGSVRPYDSNGANISCRYCRSQQTYYLNNGGSFGNVTSSTRNNNSFSLSMVAGSTSSANFTYMSFPGSSDYCARSIIVAQNATAANALLNQTSGYIIQNYYNQLPTISKTVLQNNDWTSIYNSYVTNVQNNSESYTNPDGSINISELRKILKRYNDSIVSAIADGVTNIADQVNYTNEWLDRIYNLLIDIRTILQDGGSGSGGGSSSDLTTIETYLQSIDTDIGTLLSDLNTIEGYISTNNTQNQQIYTLLQNIYSALLNLGSGGDNNTLPSPSDDPYKPWFDTLHDFPEEDVLSIISKFDVIKSVLTAAGPFALITGVTAVISGLDSEPVDPVFTIPVSIERLNIDDTMEVDLTVTDSIIDLVHGLFIILFIVGIIMFDWWIIPKLLYIFKI